VLRVGGAESRRVHDADARLKQPGRQPDANLARAALQVLDAPVTMTVKPYLPEEIR
jgi:hypothetical protein